MKRGVPAVFAALLAFTLFAQNDLAEIKAKVEKSHPVIAVDKFHGFDRVVFDFRGYEAWVCCPTGASRPGKPWSWVMQWSTAFVPRTNVPQMLRDGYHHVTINTFKHRMDETGLAVSADFQKFLVEELAFAPKAYLIGMSWGGFFSVRYAVHYPQNVAKMYLDAPLFCFQNGRSGIGPWMSRMPAEGWPTSPEMPVNMAEQVAKAGIPILLLYGGADPVVVPSYNCEPFIERFRKAGGEIQVVKRAMYAHHPHGVEWGETTIKRFFERPPAKPIAAFPGEISVKTPGWKYISPKGETEYLPAEGLFPSKGGRLESSFFKLDKKPDENAFYRLTFSAKCATNGLWWVDMNDAAGGWLPDVNSRIHASADYRGYEVLVPMRPDAVEAKLAFVAPGELAVKDARLIRISAAEAKDWVNRTYAAGPKLPGEVTAEAWKLLPGARTAIKVAKNFSIVFLGDSIMNDTWCGGFDALLRQEYPDTDFRSWLSVRGSTGCWYYREKKNFDDYVARYRPNLVVIGGISNYQAERGMTKEAAIEAVVETAKLCQAIGAEVVISTPPRWAKAADPDRYEVMAEAAKRAGVQLWDMTTAPNRAVDESGKDREWFNRDAVHGNDRGKVLNTMQMFRFFNAAQK